KAFFVCQTGSRQQNRQGQRPQDLPQAQGQRQSQAPERCTSDEVLVVLMEDEGAGPADVEGRVDVNAGQMLSIPSGRVEHVQTANMQGLGLTDEARSLAQREQIFIVADGVNITSRQQQDRQNQQARQGQESQQTPQSRQNQPNQAQQRQQDRGGQAGAEIVSLENWDYETLYRTGWSAEELMNADVIGENGEDIGSVENLIIDEQGQIAALIAQVGGFIDIGDTHIAVPWNEVDVRNADEVQIPVREDNIDNYTGINDDYFTQVDVGDLQRVDDDVVSSTGFWKASELLDDDVVLQDGDRYGYVTDLIFNEQGNLESVVINSANPSFGYGYYAYPWYGPGFGAWDPGLGYYTLPYGATEIGEMTAFDYDILDQRGLY
ncbi:MAG: PRC-barrel domain-containing protein, partial [Gammaproteobacteria bacterium]|nr:PRC-barrel domain-containing protein [Gammaproteobacteria bacterium]